MLLLHMVCLTHKIYDRLRLADAVLAAGLADLGSQLHLLEDGDNLAFTESAFLHVGTPSYHGILYHRLAQVFEEAT